MKKFFALTLLALIAHTHTKDYAPDKEFKFDCNNLGFHLGTHKAAQKARAQEHCHQMADWLEMAKRAAKAQSKSDVQGCLRQADEHFQAAMRATDPVEVAGIAQEVYDHAKQYNGPIVKEEGDNVEFALQLRAAAKMIEHSPTDAETQKQLTYIAWTLGYHALEKYAYERSTGEKAIDLTMAVGKNMGTVAGGEFAIVQTYHRLNKTDNLTRLGITGDDLTRLTKHAIWTATLFAAYHVFLGPRTTYTPKLPMSPILLKLYEQKLIFEFEKHQREAHQD